MKMCITDLDGLRANFLTLNHTKLLSLDNLIMYQWSMNNSVLLRPHSRDRSTHCLSIADHRMLYTGSLALVVFHSGIASSTDISCESLTSGSTSISLPRSASNWPSVRWKCSWPAAYTLTARKSSHVSPAVLVANSCPISRWNSLSVTDTNRRYAYGSTTVSLYVGSFTIVS